MSKQFDIYVVPSDAISLVEELKTRFGVRVLKEHSPSIVPIELPSPIRETSTWLRTVGSTSIRCYLTPEDGRIVNRYLEGPNDWIIDPISEAIEVSGCDHDGWTLFVGRFYFQTDFVNRGELVKKSPKFIAWADSVFRYTKRMLRRDREVDAYVGKGAMLFRETGGVFTRDLPKGPIHANSIAARISPAASRSLKVH